MNSKDKAELTRLFFAAKDSYMEFALAKPSISNLGMLTAEDNFLKFLDSITKIELEANWANPWEDVVIVPIEELAECHANLGQLCSRYTELGTELGINRENFTLTKESVLDHWRSAGDKLDAYILPQPSGEHNIGIRYGNKGSEYLSPMGDKEKVQALLNKYRP